MLTKEILIEQADNLPKEFSIDDLVEKLILVEKINRGIDQSKKNMTISDEELDIEMSKWFE
jgi:hypothetical protein